VVPFRVARSALGAALFLSLVWTADVAGQARNTCAGCHANREFLAGRGDAPGADNALFVPDSLLHDSRHATLTCQRCHMNYDDAYPHQPAANTVGCASCHEPEQSEWAASIHAENLATQGDAPTCAECHGVHQVLGAEERRARTHPLREAELCGSCHNEPRILETYFADPADSVARTAVDRFHETVHGIALAEGGLVVTATCSDCHRPHRVLPSDSVASSIFRDSIPVTCGECHVGVLEDYGASAHGRALSEGTETDDGHGAPVCVDCHTSHQIVEPDAGWRADVIEECGTCHEALFETYLHTYHGKVTQLGSALAARCSDCHTAHANLPPDDVASSVHESNLVATCGNCHEGINASFVQYIPHPRHDDRANFPELYWPWLFMTILLFGTIGFFGLHTVLWLGRALVEKAAGAPGHGPRAATRLAASGAGPARPEDDSVDNRTPAPARNDEYPSSPPGDPPRPQDEQP
jgi:protein-arginine kinase activator protein McsA